MIDPDFPKKRPWDMQVRTIPLRTYSGKVVRTRKKHYISIEDVVRIMNKINIPDETAPEDFVTTVIRLLRRASIAMIQRLLMFLDERAAAELYDWCDELLDKLFGINQGSDRRISQAKSLIITVATRAGIKIEFK